MISAWRSRRAGPLAQTGSLVGLYGLDILAIVIFAAPATLVDRRPGQRGVMTGATRCRGGAFRRHAGASARFRLATNETEYVDGVKLRLMQPNLPQDAKFHPENGAEILRHYLALSDRATAPGHSGVADVTHLIWPESAFPYVLSREPQALARDRARAARAISSSPARRASKATARASAAGFSIRSKR